VTTSGPGREEESFRARLAALLEWSKPYRDLIALAIAVIGGISATVAWVVAHFATQAELLYMECRLNQQLTSQSYNSQLNLLAAKIDARSSQLRELSSQDPPIGGPPTAQLAADVSSLNEESARVDLQSRKDLDEIAKKCSSVTPASGHK
jgi:hypothetical protein